MSDHLKEKKEETKFCRLCGKNRPLADIVDIVLATNSQGTQQIVYKGCKSCAVTIHNAGAIIKETLDQVRAKDKIAVAAPKIIIPGMKEFKM